MAFVGMLRKMLKDTEIGKLSCNRSGRKPHLRHGIAFPHVGIYSSVGQRYEPVDVNTLLYYKEAKNGQILEEGITEAGSMASCIARAQLMLRTGSTPFRFSFTTRCSASSALRISSGPPPTCACGVSSSVELPDALLSGEKDCKHQDGNSHVLALPVPNVKAYDPAFAYEIAVIIQDGIHRMYKDGESVFYYITVMNEPYAMPPMPGDVKDGILRGMYRFRPAANGKAKLRAQLFGSGAILNEVLHAQEILESKYGGRRRRVSVTVTRSFITRASSPTLGTVCIRRKGARALRHQMLADAPGVLVAASDYLKPCQYDQQMDAAALGVTRHRWLRAQRRPRLLA